MRKLTAILLAVLIQLTCFSFLFSMNALAGTLENKIYNGDFEDYDEQTGAVDGFAINTSKNGSATVSSAIDTTVKSPAGSNSIRIDMAGIGSGSTASGMVYTTNTYTLKRNCYYELSVWVKTQNSYGTTLSIYEPNYIKRDKTTDYSASPIEGQNIYTYSYDNGSTRVIRKHITYTYTANGMQCENSLTGVASMAIMRGLSGNLDASTTFDPQNQNNGWVEFKMTFRTTDEVDPTYNVTDDVPVAFAVSTRTQTIGPEAKIWIADFKLTEQFITAGWAEAEDGAGTIVSSPELCAEGDTVTFIATPKSGNTFLGWYQGDQLLSTNPDLTTSFNPSAKYIAKFNISTPVVVVAENDGGIVSAEPAGGSEGTPITLTARPYDGNTFNGWYHGDTKISDDLVCETTFDPSKPYTAKFIIGNLIEDPGFENYAVGTNLMGSTWNHNSGSATWLSAKITNQKAYSGSKSLQLFARYQKVYSRIEGLKPNTVYTLSFYWYMEAYTPTNKNTLTGFGVMPENITEGQSSGSLGFSIGPNATGSWQKAMVYFATGPNDTAGNIAINYSSETSDTNLGAIYIDELAVFEGGPKPGEPIDLLDPDSDDAIKVLAIGNSFSGNATKHLKEMAIADNVDLRVGNMSIGGASLELHASNAVINSPSYDFVYYSKYRTASYSNTSLEQALKATDWDYVTIQQASPLSGKYDTSYQPYANNLMAYIRQKCPSAQIVIHQTWAYETGYENLERYYPHTDEKTAQEVMWDGIFYSYNRLAQDAGDAPILPSGAAWQETRGTSVGDTLAIDGYHGNERGIMLANYVWYEFFTGITPFECKYDPTVLSTTQYPITNEIANILKEKAHFALQGFKLAHEIIVGIKNLGPITIDSLQAIETLESQYYQLKAYDQNSTNNVSYTGAVTNYNDLKAARATYNELFINNDLKPGDIDGDKKVDLKDVTVLSRYIAGWQGITYVEAALDVNGDGSVDLKDVTLLARYIAGWDVTLHVDPSTTIFRLSQASSRAGRPVSVKVSLSGYSKLGGDIAGYQFTVTYDISKLEFVGYTPSADWAYDFNVTGTGTAVIVADDKNNPALTIKSNGEIGTLNFNIKNDVTGDTEITLEVTEVTNSNAVAYPNGKVSGSTTVVTITQGPVPL